MKKLKLAFYFIKIKLHNIFNLLIKTATAYVVAGFAIIQVSSIVVDNVSTQAVLGLSTEAFMQLLFIAIPTGLPLVLIVTYILKRKSIDQEVLLTDEVGINISSNYKQKIGVIPFENLNNDNDGAFLVDGIVEDLITELSMIQEIAVATRKTCFSLRGKDFTTSEFKEEYGLDYIVSGSIRSIDNRLRISVELCDMDDGNVIWSNKYDRVKTDIFEVQDEIVTKIINSMHGEIEINSLKRAHRKPTENMTSYEYTLKGRALNQKFEKDANAEAIKVLDAAIEADKTNPLPYSWKACTIGQAMTLGFIDKDEDTMATFIETLSKANEMNDNDWNTNRILAEANLTLHQYDQSKVYATKAFNANPNNPHVLSIYADSLLRNGQPDKAIETIKKMYELEPIPLSDSNSDRPLRALYFAHYINKDFEKCRDIFTKIEEIDIRTWLTRIDIEKSHGAKCEEEAWFKAGLEKFRDSDWKKEINLFHLNDKAAFNNLLNVAQSI